MVNACDECSFLYCMQGYSCSHYTGYCGDESQSEEVVNPINDAIQRDRERIDMLLKELYEEENEPILLPIGNIDDYNGRELKRITKIRELIKSMPIE